MPKKPSKQITSISEEDKQLFLDAVERLPKHSTKIWLEESISNKPKKKSVGYDARIDLHGFTKTEAHHKLKHFIGISQRNGFRKVLVVHGKGAGVLRSFVREFLADSFLVSQVEEAKPRWGGEGAVLVQLRRKANDNLLA